jgi:hypothetical protein
MQSHQHPRPLDPDPFALHQLPDLLEVALWQYVQHGATFGFQFCHLLAKKQVMCIHMQ